MLFQDSRRTLHLAALSGQLDVARYLIEEVDVNAGLRDKVSHTDDD